MIALRRLDSTQADFQDQLAALRAYAEDDGALAEQVAGIISAVRTRGDAALMAYTQRFDGLAVGEATQLEVPLARAGEAYATISQDLRAALEEAAERIRRYAERQRLESWRYTEADGTMLGQQITPLDRVGLYVPGGKAAYPSSLLMNAIPAKVAGVDELIMVTPAPDGRLNDLVLAAAAIVGVDRIFRIGGAQAIAALAYGTGTVPRVDKIVGPGNAFVAMAKRLVFGQVGIDMIAGPSEILIICDGKTNPDWIAMDLFSQAEHDQDAQAILLCQDTLFIDQVAVSIDRLLPKMPRAEIIEAALNRRGALIRVRDLDEAVAITNALAPEHLELSVAEPESLAQKIRHAGAIFLGRFTAEAVGDYCAGPNHVLPTAGTARFSSPLGVYDFQKRSSLIGCSVAGAAGLGRMARTLALGEGLSAHAQSAGYRMDVP